MFNKPKKLKEISYSVVSYIQIETEKMKDYNDKHMISGYCLSKLRMVEWYIQLLQTGNENYIVPQSISELEMIRDELKECHRQIMNKKITPSEERPSYGFKYPKGYEG